MRITVYESSDGEIFRTHKEFVAHEAMLSMEPGIHNLIAQTTKFPVDGGEFEADDRGNLCLYTESLKLWVLKNANELRNILNNSLDIKRPRAKKAAKA